MQMATWAVLALSSLLAVTGCENKGKRIKIKRDPFETESKLNKTDRQKMNAFVSDGCLNLELVRQVLAKDPAGLVSVHTNDLDLGNYQWLDSETPRTFIPAGPSPDVLSAKARTFICSSHRPLFITQQAVEFLKSDLATDLLGTSQQNCDTVIIENREFKIENKLAQRLTLRNSDKNEVREYIVRSEGLLEIKIYQTEKTGVEGAGWVKKSFIFSWGEQPRYLNLDRRFATLLKDTVQTPTDFDQLLERKQKRAQTLSVDPMLFQHVIDQAAENKLKVSCP